MMRRFELHRDEDVSGVSGTGVVAQGVAFSEGGPVALRWASEWPTSVVFHDRGIESLEAVHGHNGRTRIVWLDDDEGHELARGHTINSVQPTWQQLHAKERDRASALNAWRVLVSDLDRNEHGRHEGDVDSGDPTGTSQGNPHLPTGATLGYTLDGRPIIQPPRSERGKIEAWTPEP